MSCGSSDAESHVHKYGLKAAFLVEDGFETRRTNALSPYVAQ